ncbi:MAG TPA: FtsX-like permease family protein [Solirubrobacterales bacterium]|nr:FtsX-like permease family protein [Solirubrobacterales bacterium]
MSRRFWLRWSRRDLRRRWVQVVATSLVIAIGTGLYGGLGGMQEWREQSNDRSFSQLAYHDLRVDLSQGGHLRAGRLAATLSGTAGVRAVQERLIVPTQVDASTRGQTVLVPGQIVGIPTGKGPRVDALAAHTGRTLGPGDARTSTVVLDRAFASHYGLPPAGHVRLAGLGRVPYAGQVHAPQFFIVSGTGFGGEATFAVVHAPLRTAQRAAGRPGQVNQAVLRLDPGVDVQTAERSVRSALDRALPQVGTTVTRGTDEPAYRVLYSDARNDQRILDVFAFLVLGGAALAAFNLISRVVESERREIGVGMALGVPPRLLALRPVLMGVQIALLGVVLGLAIGIAFAAWLSDVLREQLPLPSYAASFRGEVFAVAATLGLILPLAATAYPVWRGVRVSPVEAIRVGFRSAKGGGFAPLLKRIRLPGSSLAQMPLRNVVRAPRRTIMTMLGLAAVITTVVALSGMFDSFGATVDGIEKETLRQTPNRLDVQLDGFHPRDSRAVRDLERTPEIDTAEPTLRLAGELRARGESIDVAVTLVDPRSALWTPTVEDGTLRAGSRGIVIARKAADDLELDVGDELTLRHPVRRGTVIDQVDTRVPVAGVHPNPLRIFAYMDRGQAPLFGLAGQANRVTVVPARGVSEQEAQRSLFGRPGVASVQPVAAEAREVKQAVDEFREVITVTETVTLFLALLMAFNSASISMDERRREYATLFAFGVPVRSGLRLAVAESVFVGALGTLIGILGGVAVVSWTMNELLGETLPDLGPVVTLGSGSILIALAVGIGAVALAPLLMARRLRRMDIPSTLRVVE